MYQPTGGGEFHSAVFQSVWQIYKFLVLSDELIQCNNQAGIFKKIRKVADHLLT
jgi:hypothetical protein